MNNTRRDSAVNTHVLNIRTGLINMKTKYGLHVDEYDYLDIAVDVLRDIRHYGTSEYYAIVNTDEEGNFPLPCNVSMIDAVTGRKQGIKQFKDRIKYEMLDNYGNDHFFKAENISRTLDWDSYFKPGLTGLVNPDGYISYQLNNDTVMLGKDYKNTSVVIAFTGISVDEEGFPLINRKQANALAASAAKYHILKKAMKGEAKYVNMIELISGECARLVQAASIPENITDNELDELLDAKVTFNRKTFGRPTKYSR